MNKKELIESWRSLPADVRERVPNSHIVDSILADWVTEDREK